jgi:hypothetical protein
MKRCCGVVLVSLILIPIEASADGSLDPLEDFVDPQAPQKLLADGRALMRTGHYADACAKLEESIRLDASLGAQFDLADCNEHIGKITSAWAGFVEIARSTSAEQAEHKRTARQRVRALEKTLPKLLIAVPGPGVEIRRDGMMVPQAEWGTMIPVDPGQHRVTAAVPGRPRWLTIVDASAGETTRVEVPQDLVPPPENDDVSAPAPADGVVQCVFAQRSGRFVLATAY